MFRQLVHILLIHGRTYGNGGRQGLHLTLVTNIKKTLCAHKKSTVVEVFIRSEELKHKHDCTKPDAVNMRQ